MPSGEGSALGFGTMSGHGFAAAYAPRNALVFSAGTPVRERKVMVPSVMLRRVVARSCPMVVFRVMVPGAPASSRSKVATAWRKSLWGRSAKI